MTDTKKYKLAITDTYGVRGGTNFEYKIIWDPEGRGRRPEENKRLALSVNMLFILLIWQDIKGCKIGRIEKLFGIKPSERETISYLTSGHYNGEQYTPTNSRKDSKTANQSRAKTLSDKTIDIICNKMGIDADIFKSSKAPGIFEGHSELQKLLIEEMEWIEEFEYAKESWNQNHKNLMSREILKGVIERANRASDFEKERLELENEARKNNKKKRTNKEILKGEDGILSDAEISKKIEDVASKEIEKQLKGYLTLEGTEFDSIRKELYLLRAAASEKMDEEIDKLVKNIEKKDGWKKEYNDKYAKDYLDIEKERHEEDRDHRKLIESLQSIYDSMMAVPDVAPRTNVQKITYFLRHENTTMDGMATEMAKRMLGFLSPKEFWNLIKGFELSEREYLIAIDNYKVYESMLVAKAAYDGINVSSLNRNCKKFDTK